METTTDNPFYTQRLKRPVALPTKPVYAKLPLAPINASPVPGLTSLYHNSRAGEYGDRGYPGNCGGNLIRDLLVYFKPKQVFDPMTGSGTCRDVCQELGIPCESTDIHNGFDACNPLNFFGEAALYRPGSFDFVWLHPPYWRMKLYADDPRDLSRCPTLDAFLERYTLLLAHARYVLKPGGILAVLMGDYCDRREGFVPLTYYTKKIASIAASSKPAPTSSGSATVHRAATRSTEPRLSLACTMFACYFRNPSKGGRAMTNKLIELTEAAFDAMFPLLPNRFDANAAWTVDDGLGRLFATYGPELDYVLAQDPATVWTFLDGDDGGQFVISGLRLVNRIGYLVSASPRPSGIDVIVRISTEVDGECA